MRIQHFGQLFRNLWLSAWRKMSKHHNAAEHNTPQDEASDSESGMNIMSLFARDLIRQGGLDRTNNKPLIILDSACGDGVISTEIFNLLDEHSTRNMELICGEISTTLVRSVRHTIELKAWAKTKALVLDAQDTREPSNRFTHVLMGFAIYLTDATATLNECRRILRPNGICAFSTFSHIGWAADLREALATLPRPPPFPNHDQLIERFQGHWGQPEYVKNMLLDHGFEDVRVEVMTRHATCKNADDFWDTVENKIKTVRNGSWSAEDKERCGSLVEGAVKNHIDRKYGKGTPFKMTWGAVLATGRKPQG